MKIRKKGRKSNPAETKDRILSKFTTGRTKAIKKRNKTLLLEYKLKNKSNKFVDRRIGERNKEMTYDDRIMARFVAHRVKAHKKQALELGNDSEMLTHRGRSLEDVEKFDNPQSDTDDEEDGQLEADFVEKTHFGGGLFKKSTRDENDTRRTIDQLIAESKMRKAERQQVKEETQTLTDKLDDDLKQYLPLISNSTKSEDDTTFKKPDLESYDVLVRELRFAPIGKPTDKLKTAEQITNEERQRLQQLEKERLERMKRQNISLDDEEEPPEKKHCSADDLDDGLNLDVFDDESGDEEGDDVEEEEDDDEDGDENEEESGDDEEDESTANVEEAKTKEVEVNRAKIVTSKPLFNMTVVKRVLSEKNAQNCEDIVEDCMQKIRTHTGVSNKESSLNLFNCLLEFIDSLFNENVTTDSWKMISKLSPILFELSQICGDTAAESMRNVISKKYTNFAKNTKQDATLDTLIALKLIPLLYPTSDFWHPVTTPSTTFLCHILSQNACKSLRSIAKGLFACTALLEYVSLSKRYCPEAITFLRNVLYTGTRITDGGYAPVNAKNTVLVLSKKMNEAECEQSVPKLSPTLLSHDIDESDECKSMLLHVTIKLLHSYFECYNELSATYLIWQPVVTLLEALPKDDFSSSMKSHVDDLLVKIKSKRDSPLQYLVAERKRPKALRLYEPNIRPIIEGRSLRTVSQAKLENEKLMHQYKREMKGALREIRKDRNFIARVRVTEQTKRDAERKEKVKRIFGWGQSQQHDLKKMERQNRFVRRKR